MLWETKFSNYKHRAPRNFKLTAVSPYCVSLGYDPVLYPNGPESGIVYQVLISIDQQLLFLLL